MTTIHLHEIMDTVPGQEEPYMASVLSLEDDVVSRNIGARRGDISSATSTSRFRTTDVSGPWPKSVNLAEPGSFERAMHSLGSQFSGTGMSTDMEDWWQRNTSLRTHGFDRWLLPASFSPPRKDLLSKGLKGRVFLHEFIKVAWGETDDYLARLERDFLPAATRYEWLLFGAYTVAMSPPRNPHRLLHARVAAHGRPLRRPRHRPRPTVLVPLPRGDHRRIGGDGPHAGPQQRALPVGLTREPTGSRGRDRH